MSTHAGKLRNMRKSANLCVVVNHSTMVDDDANTHDCQRRNNRTRCHKTARTHLAKSRNTSLRMNHTHQHELPQSLRLGLPGRIVANRNVDFCSRLGHSIKINQIDTRQKHCQVCGQTAGRSHHPAPLAFQQCSFSDHTAMTTRPKHEKLLMILAQMIRT